MFNMKHICGAIVRWEKHNAVPKYQNVIEKFPEILLDTPMVYLSVDQCESKFSCSPNGQISTGLTWHVNSIVKKYAVTKYEKN